MRALLLVAALLLPGVAWAQSKFLLMGVGTPTAVYVGPGDITTLTGFWSLRAYTAAIAAAGTQKLVNVRRTSDSETCDFLVAASGGVGLSTGCSGADNGVSLATFMNATTGFATKLYDQTGGGRDWVQATSANQPQVILNCLNTSLPCLEATANAQLMATAANFTPATGVVTLTMVANRVSSTTNFASWIRENGGTGNRVAAGVSTNTWTISGGTSGTLSRAANDNSWHAASAVINGASSVFNIDGGEGTGTVTGSTGAGLISGIQPSAAITIRMAEIGFTDNVAWSAGTRTAICHNQFLYWATSTSC